MKCIDNQAIVSQVWFVLVKKSSNFKEKQPINLNTPLSGITQKIHKMGAPLFNFQPRTPHDPVTPLEELLSRSNTFFCFLKDRGPLKKFLKSVEMLTI
jgi:hypothetical protein